MSMYLKIICICKENLKPFSMFLLSFVDTVMVKSDKAMSHLSEVYFVLDYCHYCDIDFTYKLNPHFVVTQLYLV
jgi:hypothetical protein